MFQRDVRGKSGRLSVSGWVWEGPEAAGPENTHGQMCTRRQRDKPRVHSLLHRLLLRHRWHAGA